MLPEFEYIDFNEVRKGDLVQCIKENRLVSEGALFRVENVVHNNLIELHGLPGRWTEDFFSLVKVKLSSEVSVGDYMFRIERGTDRFPLHTTKKIRAVVEDSYEYSPGFQVLQTEVMVPYLKTNKTKKEQKPMKKLQDIINQIFGITDYEQKPNYLVVVYSADGAEIAQTIATNIEEVESKFKTTPSLIGCTAVCYKATTEITTEIPVVTTKLKDKHDNK